MELDSDKVKQYVILYSTLAMQTLLEKKQETSFQQIRSNHYSIVCNNFKSLKT